MSSPASVSPVVMADTLFLHDLAPGAYYGDRRGYRVRRCNAAILSEERRAEGTR